MCIVFSWHIRWATVTNNASGIKNNFTNKIYTWFEIMFSSSTELPVCRLTIY